MSNERQKARRLRRIAKGREILGGVCVTCGVDQNLDFDHIDPSTKSFDLLGKKWSVAEPVWLEELSKCQLLCKRCHDEKTHGDARKNRKHGTYTMYKRGKCRCGDCIKAFRVKSKEYNDKHRRSKGH